MTTQELKEYIDRVLGNNIRCLLPSYWWKRLFGLVVDKIDDINTNVKSVDKKVKNKQDALVSGTNIKTVNGESILGEGNLEVGIDISNLATKDELNALQNSVIENEEIIAAALTDLEAMIRDLQCQIKELKNVQ